LVQCRFFGIAGFEALDLDVFQIDLGRKQVAFHHHALLVQFVGDTDVFLGGGARLFGHLDVGAGGVDALIGHQ